MVNEGSDDWGENSGQGDELEARLRTHLSRPVWGRRDLCTSCTMKESTTHGRLACHFIHALNEMVNS